VHSQQYGKMVIYHVQVYSIENYVLIDHLGTPLMC